MLVFKFTSMSALIGLVFLASYSCVVGMVDGWSKGALGFGGSARYPICFGFIRSSLRKPNCRYERNCRKKYTFLVGYLPLSPLIFGAQSA
jgi:hypothetical protein